MTTVAHSDPAFTYEGRIARRPDGTPLWVFPYTQARFRFTGTSLAVRVRNAWNYGNIRLGVVIDDTQYAVRVPSPAEPGLPAGCVRDGDVLVLPVADHLPAIEHACTVFKRQDGGMHYLDFVGVDIDDGARLLPTLDAPSERHIEIYGDSVTCGERNEAVLYQGLPDPDVDLSAYSNAWMSYGALAARALGAQVRLIAQGGVPLLDGIGWFNGPDFLGMERMWDRTAYNPALGETLAWEFADGYDPQVVVVALGQNDSHPTDFMAQDYDSAQSAHWRAEYARFLGLLRGRYPGALIVCTTTVMEHDAAWDRAIDEAVAAAADPRITHFSYARAGTGTPGHPRVPEDREMARELAAYLESFGPVLWTAR